MRFGLLLLLFSTTVSATTVNLSLEKEVYRTDEPVRIQLVIDPTKPVGGQLMVYKKADDNKYSIARLLYTKPTPEQCLTCTRDRPLSDYLSRTFIFDSEGEGDYLVEVNFAGIQKSLNFTVGSTTTSTTTNILTTTSITPTTTSVTSTSTTSSTPSTTTVIQSTTMALEHETDNIKTEKSRWWLYALLLILSALFLMYTPTK